MPIRTYIGERFIRTHENRAFDQMVDLLESAWGDSEELVILLGNFFCDGIEIDAAVIRQRSITVIDLKHYGGQVVFSENGPWYADDVRVKGGNKRNPYIQIRDNRFGLMKWLERAGVLGRAGRHGLGHISGFVVFDQPIRFDRSQLPPKIAPWFDAVDIDHCVRSLSQVASPQINLTEEEMEAIPRALGLDQYVPASIGVPIQEKPWRESHVLEIPEALRPTLTELTDILADGHMKTCVIKGMMGTGIATLAASVAADVRSSGRGVQVLAPNRRLAERSSLHASSIYSYIYGGQPRVDESVLVRPLQPNEDADDILYVVLDAHLLSDSLFETDVLRFGSGHLLRDFIDFVEDGSESRQVVFFGDPYQISVGRSDETALSGAYLQRLLEGARVHEIELDYLLPESADSTAVVNALGIVRQIKAGKYNHLVLHSGDAIRVEESGEDMSPEEAQRRFSPSPGSTKYVEYANFQVTARNRHVRHEVFGRDEQLAPGDLVHFHNAPRGWDSGDSGSAVFVSKDSFGEIVEVFEDLDPIVQPLRGRETPVEIRLGRARVRLLGDSARLVDLHYLRDYLYSVHPEVDPEVLVALRVRAQSLYRQETQRGRSDNSHSPDVSFEIGGNDVDMAEYILADPYLNAARMRFGYALTLHRAQGCVWPSLLVNLETDQGKTNESYFRWVYTAFAIAGRELVLMNAVPITPLSKMVWDEKGARLDSVRPRNLVPVTGQADFPAALRPYVESKCASAKFAVASTQSLQYQERYVIRAPDGRETTLNFVYNKQHEVTRIDRMKSTPAEFAEEVIRLISGVRFDDPFQEEVYTLLMEKLRPEGFSLASIEHHQRRETYYVEHACGLVRFDVDYSDEGFVTRVAPTGYTNPQVLVRLRSALTGQADV